MATCTAPSEAFTSQIGGYVCDVVVRVNATATQLLSYKVVCGSQSTLTLEQAKAQLLPSSRINWSEATSYRSDSDGYLFVHETPYDVVAFGPITGQPVFEFYADGQPEQVLGDWKPATDLNGTCNGLGPDYLTHLGPWQDTDPGLEIMQLLHEHGVFYGIDRANGGTNGTLIVRADLSAVEYFVVISTAPRV
jgi:hypothetical protein